LKVSGGLPLVLGALAVLAVVLLRWTSADYDALGRLSDGAIAASFGLWVMHGLLVALSAIAAVWPIDVPRPAALAVGLLLAGAGALLAGGGLRAMGSRDQVLGRSHVRLVTHGPFRLSRHPQALGWGLVLLGAALAGRSGLALALVLAYALLVTMQLRVEERHLAQTYGDLHRAYRERTPAILGRRRTATPSPRDPTTTTPPAPPAQAG
jgi:protein-S-isoprenylcysteine O-methyltransferase Ste14